MCNESDWGCTKGSESYPNLVEILYGGNDARKNVVDGDGIRHGEGALETRDDDLETRATAETGCGKVRRLKKFSTYGPHGYIYPYSVDQTERNEIIGGTEDV